jgi:hypothetical protein
VSLQSLFTSSAIFNSSIKLFGTIYGNDRTYKNNPVPECPMEDVLEYLYNSCGNFSSVFHS